MEDLIKQLTFYLAAAIEAGAGIIIGLAAIEATLKAFLLFFRYSRSLWLALDHVFSPEPRTLRAVRRRRRSAS